MAGISIPSLILILVIVVLIFGTKKLRNIGSDLGGALSSFRKAAKDVENDPKEDTTNLIDGESENKDD